MKRILIIMAVMIGLSSLACAEQMSRRNWNAFIPAGKIVQMHMTWVDPAAVTTSTSAYLTASISTATLVAGTSEWALTTDFNDSAVARNVVVQAYFATGIASTSFTGSLLIEGTDHRNKSTSETVAVSSNSAAGNVAWRSIDTMTLTTTAISSASTDAIINIGYGAKLGLGNDLLYTDDINIVNEAGSRTTTYTGNVTYDTIDFVTDPNGTNDYTVDFYTPLW